MNRNGIVKLVDYFRSGNISSHIVARKCLLSASLCALLICISCGGGSSSSTSSTTITTGSSTYNWNGTWTLVWSDEFDTADGTAPDATKWTYDVGAGSNGWGNQELESYTSRPQNVQITNGNLVITALKESYTGTDGVARNYTSARLKTEGLFSQQYGRFEARIKLPAGQGMWPAFWMLGNNITTAGWPACGEVDIMENVGLLPSTVYGSIHGPNGSGEASLSSSYALASGKFSDDYHIFAVEWEPGEMRFYVDGALYESHVTSDMTSGSWVFDQQPMFIILNLAVGGSWPGSPDSTTVFPQQMLVDYVHVYKRE